MSIKSVIKHYVFNQQLLFIITFVSIIGTYFTFQLYHYHLINDEKGTTKSLFDNGYMINLTTSYYTKTINSSDAAGCYLFPSQGENVTVTLYDENNEVKYFYSNELYDMINIGISNEVPSLHHIPDQIKKYFYYSPSEDVLSPAVIIATDIFNGNQFMTYLQSKLNLQIEDFPKELASYYFTMCIYDINYLHLFFLSAIEFGNKVYDIPTISQRVFDSHLIGIIFLQIIFILFSIIMIINWAYQDPTKYSLAILVSLLYSSIYHINNLTMENFPMYAFEGSSNMIIPIVFYFVMILTVSSFEEFFSKIREIARWYFTKERIWCYLTIGCYICSFIWDVAWIAVFVLDVYMIVKTNKELTSITVLCCIICLIILAIFVHIEYYHFFSLFPYLCILAEIIFKKKEKVH